MQTRDWALVAFTLLMQASVGTIVVMTVLTPVAGRATQLPWHALDAPLAVAVIAGALALLASLIHLGHPAQAWLAVANIRTSWLSREIAASVLFVASAAAVGLLRRVDSSGREVQLVAVAAGLLVVYAMSRLYMVPAQPAWNRLLTPAAFVAGTLLLGVIVVLTTGAVEAPLARGLAVIAISLVVFQALLTPLYVSGLPGEPAAVVAAATLGSTSTWLATARIASAVAAIVLLVVSSSTGAPGSAAAGAVIFVLVSELAGRVLFYAGSASFALR